jgi:hypothetical protein
LKNWNCWKHGPDGTFHDFCNFIKVDIGHNPKTSFDPYVLFSHQNNLQKYWMSGRNYFKGQNTAKHYQTFQNLKISRNSLMLNPIENSISSSNLGDGL